MLISLAPLGVSKIHVQGWCAHANKICMLRQVPSNGKCTLATLVRVQSAT